MADIFDRMFQGVSNMAKSTGLLDEKAKLKVILEQQQANKKQFAESMGMKLYEQMLNGGPVIEDLNEFFVEMQKCDEAIKGYEARIQILEQQYAQSRQPQQPPKAQQIQYPQQPPQYQPQPQPQNPQAPMPEKENIAQPQVEKRICAACGFSNSPAAKFCAKCGTKLI